MKKERSTNLAPEDISDLENEAEKIYTLIKDRDLCGKTGYRGVYFQQRKYFSDHTLVSRHSAIRPWTKFRIRHGLKKMSAEDKELFNKYFDLCEKTRGYDFNSGYNYFPYISRYNDNASQEVRDIFLGFYNAYEFSRFMNLLFGDRKNRSSKNCSDSLKISYLSSAFKRKGRYELVKYGSGFDRR